MRFLYIKGHSMNVQGMDWVNELSIRQLITGGFGMQDLSQLIPEFPVADFYKEMKQRFNYELPINYYFLYFKQVLEMYFLTPLTSLKILSDPIINQNNWQFCPNKQVLQDFFTFFLSVCHQINMK